MAATKKLDILPYTQASQWAQQENILTKDQWIDRCSKHCPKEIPADPENFYTTEFSNWHNFLGTQLSRDGRKTFWLYERVKQWAKQQNISTEKQWREMVKSQTKTEGIPAQPLKVYSAICTSWNDFFDTKPSKTYCSYQEAMQWAKDNNITSQSQWKTKIKENPDLNMPFNANRFYKEQFTSWGEFLGTGRVANKDREFLSYEEAIEWAKEQGLSSVEEWHQRTKKDFPKNIPVAPHQVYGKQFSWNDFLGCGTRKYYGRRQKANLLSYQEALDWGRTNGICSQLNWFEKCKEDGNERIPLEPHKIYPEFTNWNDFLGVAQVNGISKIERMIRYVVEMVFDDKYSDFGQAIIVDRNNKKHRVDICLPQYNLIIEYDGSYWHEHKEKKDINKTIALQKSHEKWNVIRMRGQRLSLLDPDWNISVDEASPAVIQIDHLLQHILSLHHKNIFVLPERTVEKIQFWNIERLKTINFREVLENFDNYKSYEEAVKVARENNLKTRADWINYVIKNRTDGFPYDLKTNYPNEFQGWGDFLGTGRYIRKAKDLVSYQEASDWAKSMDIESAPQWWRLSKEGKIPAYIPAAPSYHYKEKFKNNNGWYGFLGKERPKDKSKQNIT